MRDLEEGRTRSDPSAVFDLGTSGGSNLAKHKEAMLDEAFDRPGEGTP